ncbi:hypothetical protein ABZ840_34705 [Streptomyces sp. NPDC047117]|uniref:hypothetical protein n=1 Tax=Streptomyces sp. NPDC047117 TaxID=3155379 RepID=UPI0033E01520
MRRPAYAAFGLAAAVAVTGGAAPHVVNGPSTGPLVSTGDVDLLEDVLEHISTTSDGRTAHQTYHQTEPAS